MRNVSRSAPVVAGVVGTFTTIAGALLLARNYTAFSVCSGSTHALSGLSACGTGSAFATVGFVEIGLGAFAILWAAWAARNSHRSESRLHNGGRNHEGSNPKTRDTLV